MGNKKTVSEIISTYELPIIVKGELFFSTFYFRIEKINSNNTVSGTKTKDGKKLKPYSCSFSKLFLVCKSNKRKTVLESNKSNTDNNTIYQKQYTETKPNNSENITINTICNKSISNIEKCSTTNNLSTEESQNISTDPSTAKEECNNPNNLELDKSKYISGISKIYFVIKKEIVTLTFSRFDRIVSQEIILAFDNGKNYQFLFPNTNCIFSSKHDALQYILKKNDSPTNAGEEMLSKFSELPLNSSVNLNWKQSDQQEREHHNEVDKIIRKEILCIKNNLHEIFEKCKNINENYTEELIAARENGSIVDDHISIHCQLQLENINESKMESEYNLSHWEIVERSPYFARVDCGPDLEHTHIAYIGENDIDGYVFDWRNPVIGNAYYFSDSLSNEKDLVIALKRHIEIKGSKYIGFNDELNLYKNLNGQISDTTKNSNTDELLLELLKLSRTNEKTHDIIKTIQSKQYELITSDFDDNLVVDGCAGSGKTMIMYHRLSYIAYNFKLKKKLDLSQENVYVITPSPYFDYGNLEMLKKLKITGINNAPINNHVFNLMSIHYQKNHLLPALSLCDSNRYINNEYYNEKNLCHIFNDFTDSIDEINRNSNLEKEYKEWLKTYIWTNLNELDFEKNDMEAIWDKHNTNAIFKKYYQKNNYGRKSNEQPAFQYYKQLFTSFSYENIIVSLDQMDKSNKKYQKRLNTISQHKLILMYCTASKTQKTKDGITITNLSGFWHLVDNTPAFSKIIKLIITEKYISLLNNEQYNDLILKCHFAIDKLQVNLPYKIKVLFLLKLLNQKYGPAITNESLVFVDEFQNYSPFEITCLKESFKKPIFNMYGDFMQRMAKPGLSNIDELRKIFELQYYNINTNYRNAKEITEFINQRLEKEMLPIGISGRVEESLLENIQFHVKRRTAIIISSTFEYKQYLKPVLSKEIINVVSETDKIYDDKINIIEIKDCKGLEFNTVYVLDENMNTEQKYVAYTRALDTLIIIYRSKYYTYQQLLTNIKSCYRCFDGLVHETEFDNFISIMNDGFLMPRNEVKNFTDRANQDIISATATLNPEVLDCARFYYRDNTPTHFTAGYKSPVLLVFKDSLLLDKDAVFCDKSVAKNERALGKTIEQALEFNWKEILERGPYAPQFSSEKNKYRNCDFLIHNRVPTNMIKKICFKTLEAKEKAEKRLGSKLDNFELMVSPERFEQK